MSGFGKKSKGVFTSREQAGGEPLTVFRKQDTPTVNSQYVNGQGMDHYGSLDPLSRQAPVIFRHNPVQIRVPLNNNQIFVPPPPQRFLVESGHTNPSHHSQLPVQSNHIQSIQTVQPLFQSIKKTYIPHHIINEIPIMSSETKRYEMQEGDHEEFNEFEGPMLEQYEKLYVCYQQERKKNEQLQRELEEINLNKRVDPKLLSALLLKKHATTIRDVIEHRKNQCLNKLRGLFSQQKLNLETVLIQTTEETTWNSRRSV